MTIPVLVLTPSQGFGELISQILDEDGAYVTALVATGKEAVAYVKSEKPAICILDADLEDAPLDKLIDGLKIVDPNLLLVLIPSEKNEDDDPKSYNVDGFLSKPFYLPDLLTTLEKVIADSGLQNLDREVSGQKKTSKKKASDKKTKSGKQKTEAAPPAPVWIQDVSLAAQHLTRLSLESASQAALITRGDKIWAYAGELPQVAAEGLARTVDKYWAADGGSDLARFVRLEETGTEHMMYATSLGDDFVLALVFDATTPFSEIRAQAGNLASSLISDPDEPAPEADKSETIPPAVPISEPPQPVAQKPFETSPSSEGDLQPLLEDVPPSIPTDWVPETTPSTAKAGFLDDLLADDNREGVSTPQAASPAQTLPITPNEADTVQHQSTTLTQSQAETVPTQKSADEKVIEVQPVSPALYNLTYACVLIPRIQTHHLTGPLADRLSEWVTQLCLAFGWRLEHLSIRPDYLQWMVNVPPTTSPGYLIRIIRQHSSRRLFVEFPNYEEDNPSGDFWAPGYLILSGDQPPPANLIQEFSQQTRERQGSAKKK